MSMQGGLRPAPPRRPTQPTLPAASTAPGAQVSVDSAVLQSILEQLQKLEKKVEDGQKRLDDGQKRLESKVDNGLAEVREEVRELEKRFDTVDQSHQTLLTGQERLHARISTVETTMSTVVVKTDDIKSDVTNLLTGHSIVSSQVASMSFALEEEQLAALKAGEDEEGRLVPMSRVKAAVAGFIDLVVTHSQMFRATKKEIKADVIPELKREVIAELRPEIKKELEKEAKMKARQSNTSPVSGLSYESPSESSYPYSGSSVGQERTVSGAKRTSSHTFGRPGPSEQRSATPPTVLSH